MAEGNLFEAAKPILKFYNYVYGINLERGTEQTEAWREKMCRWNFKLTASVNLLFLAVMLLLLHIEKTVKDLHFSNICKLSAYLTTFISVYAYYVIFDAARIKMLFRRLKSFQMGKCSRNVIRKYYLLLALSIAFYLTLKFCVLISDIQEKFWPYYSIAIVLLLFVVMAIILVTTPIVVIFPLVLSSQLCFVALYCSSHLYDVMEEIKKAKSAARKAKLTNKMFVEFTRLNELAAMTNELLSDVMSVMRMLIVILMAEILNNLRNDQFSVEKLLTYVVFNLQYFGLVLIYLKVAPSANGMIGLMCKTLIDCQLEEDKWLSRDYTLRCYLIKNRLRRCEDISHQLINGEPFTISGSAVDGLDFLTIFLEISDMCNTLALGPPNAHDYFVFIVIFFLIILKQKLSR